MAKGKLKEIAVVGLGVFGSSVARAYSEMGGNVLAIDVDEEKVQEISPYVTYAVKADVTEADVVRNLGLSNMDAVLVAITNNLEASVMATILSKEEGVPYVVAKAQDEVHAKVLRKVGADKIIFPEKEMGMRLAKRLSVDSLLDLVELSPECSIIEANTPKNWIGKNILELDIRKKYGINVIGCRHNGAIDVNMNPTMPLEENMVLIVVGENDKIEKVFNE